MVYWLLLLVTIIFEVAGTIAMKLSNGLTKARSKCTDFRVLWDLFQRVCHRCEKDSFKYCLCYLVWRWNITYYNH